MASTFICTHCGKRTRKNVRIKKGQRFCGSRSCQLARKAIWDRKMNQTDKEYRESRIQSKTDWREKPRGYTYQREYRENHADYVKDNREKRLKKYHEKKLSGAKKNFVKTDALSSESPIPSGFYALFPYRSNASGKTPENFVKTDALIVQLTGLQQIAAHLLSDSSIL